MNEKEIDILIKLIDESILNYQNVHKRTKKDNWLEKANNLTHIKSKVLNLNEEIIKTNLLNSMSANLEVVCREEYGKKDYYTEGQNDVVIDFLKKI